MTTYDNLPIYHASYTLLLELFQFTREFTREYKYTLGESIKKETVEMITHIYEANSDKVGRANLAQCPPCEFFGTARYGDLSRCPHGTFKRAIVQRAFTRSAFGQPQYQ